jgi:hypothetical protein
MQDFGRWKMRAGLGIGLGIAVVIALVVGGLAMGWTLMSRQLWAAGPFAAPGAAGIPADEGCAGWGYGTGPGMMGGGATGTAPCAGWGYGSQPGAAVSSDILSIEEAHEAVERYIAALGYPNLEVAEVMEFERNFYAIVRESDTGIGAMELLVDKRTGAVGPEMGPNMMWNGRYGMHSRGGWMMGGGASATNTISAEEALQIAQRWLDTYRPGVTVEEHADPFYGYYTIHTLRDGEIEGMLSVHGATGQVWYHTWHGAFVQMTGEEESHEE